jgi:hypothetical protein
MGAFFDTMQRSQPNLDAITGYIQAARAKQKENQRRQSLSDMFASHNVMNPGQEESAQAANNLPETPVNMSDRLTQMRQAREGQSAQTQYPPAPAQVSTVGPQTHTEQKDINNLSTEDVLGINNMFEGSAAQGFNMAQANAREKRTALEQAMKAKREGMLIVPQGAKTFNFDTGKEGMSNPRQFQPKTSLLQSYIDKNKGDTEAGLIDYEDNQIKLRQAGPEATGKETRKTDAAKLPPAKPELLRTVTEKVGNEQVPVDYYGYKNRDGSETISKRVQNRVTNPKKTGLSLDEVLKGAGTQEGNTPAASDRTAAPITGTATYTKTATNPKTGAKLGLNPTTGKWEPIQR